MTSVSVRDLRNHGGEVLDTVVRGESVTVTREGVPVAELRPLQRRGPTAAELIEQRGHLQPLIQSGSGVDMDAWVLDPGL